MAILIQCLGCRRQYNVDDKLSGKMVKCKACGAAITVPAAVSDLPPVPDLAGLESPAPPRPESGRKCPSCGTMLAEGSKICVGCGLNLATGQRPPADPIALADEALGASRTRRRFVRKPGNQSLEQLDEIVKIVLLLAFFAGVIVWIVQIVKSPAGPSAGGFGPVALVGVLLAGMIAPLTAIAINMVVRKINYVPRTDTYSRVALTLMLPFSFSLMFGWPSLVGRFGGFIVLAWIIAPPLLVYYLRAEKAEWIASAATAAVCIALGWLAMTFITMAITGMTGPLYADAMPSGPWMSLATGHSPTTFDTNTTQTAAATESAGTKPAATTAVAVATATAPVAPPPATIAATAPVTPPVTPATQVAIAPTGPDMTTPPTPAVQPHPAFMATPRKIASPLLSEVVYDPGLQGISDVVVPSAANAQMLVIKNVDTTTTVERWHINPLKNEMTLPPAPYIANAPSTYSLSPKGDVLVSLVNFPRAQLELTYLEARTAKKILPLDQLQASLSLTPFLDGMRFGIRADLSAGKTAIQLCNALNGQGTREIQLESSTSNPNALAISPNGKFLATLGSDRQVAIYNTDTGQGLRKIVVSNLPFKLIRIAFSPDSSQLAVYSVVADIPTVQAFKVQTGEPLGTAAVISKKPRSYTGTPDMPVSPAGPRRGARGNNPMNVVAEEAPMPGETANAVNHDLLWLQSGKYWLVNGNEFIDTASGMKAATLDLDNIMDQYVVGDQILFVQMGENNSKNLVLARINEDKVGGAKPK